MGEGIFKQKQINVMLLVLIAVLPSTNGINVTEANDQPVGNLTGYIPV